MRLILVGPPGAGKGTQAEKLAAHFNVPHISTGDLFRAIVSENTDLAREIKTFLEAGNLVPTELTVKLIDQRLNESDAKDGFILDGFPRSVDQAVELEKIIDKKMINAVLLYKIDSKIVVERMLSRKREDDREDVITNRLEVYKQQTAPLIDYYSDILVKIDASGTVDNVFEATLNLLKGKD